MDRLIQIKGTGTPDQFAKRIGVSRRMLFEYLLLMKEMGAEIAYCRVRRSYYYTKEGGFVFRFVTRSNSS